jgi:hypothetical protein
MKESKAEREARIELEDRTPDSELTPEQRERKRARLTKRLSRTVEKEIKSASTTETEAAWWASNRALLKPEELKQLLAQQEQVLTQLWWIDNWDKFPPTDPDYVSVEDGVEDLLEFVKEFGTVHLGYIFHADIPSDWSDQKYWQNPELLLSLEGENQPTKVYVRTGILTAVPDWRVYEFLKERWGCCHTEAEWQRLQRAVGYKNPIGRTTVVYE